MTQAGCTLFGPFEFCDDCYPLPSTDLFADPTGTCAHSERPGEFFQRLARNFPETGPVEGTDVYNLIERSHGPGADIRVAAAVRHLNIYAIFLTLPWRQMLYQIPTRCPVPETPLSMRMIDNRLSHFAALVSSKSPSTVRLIVQAFVAAHGVSVTTTYSRKDLPTFRQWLPSYAPVNFFSSVSFEGYSGVPVNPRVYSLELFLQYRNEPSRFNGPKTPLTAEEFVEIEATALRESRASVSDQELERRIRDLENLKGVVSDTLVEFGDDDSLSFDNDMGQLLVRYRDELTARTLHGTSLVLGSWLFSMSSSYETTRGARFGPLPFCDQFAVAYYRMLEQGLVLRSSSAVYCMTPEFYANVRRCRALLDTMDPAVLIDPADPLLGQIVQFSQYGLLTPNKIMQ